MASIYKRGRDKGKKNAPYYFDYKDESGKFRQKKGFTDKTLTMQLACKLEHEARLRSTGLIDPELERNANNRKSAIAKHLEEYKKSQLRSNSEKHANLVCNRIQKVIDGCELSILGDIDASIVEGYLGDMLEEDDLSNRTYNHYLEAMDSFCNWLESRKQLRQNPIKGIKRLNNETDVRHKRRALKPEESKALIATAQNSKVTIQTYSGPERARIYLANYFTGFRRRELGSLQKESFDFGSLPPAVTIEASISKHRRKEYTSTSRGICGIVSGIDRGSKRRRVSFSGP